MQKILDFFRSLFHKLQIVIHCLVDVSVKFGLHKDSKRPKGRKEHQKMLQPKHGTREVPQSDEVESRKEELNND